MAKISTYLNFNGNTEEAFNFYKSVFGGEFTFLQRFKDEPANEQASDEDKEKIMHIRLPIGNGHELMATDSLESMGQMLNFGDNFSIFISTESKEEANILYKKLSGGGKIQMPLHDSFWGDYFGMLKDKFNIQWMISFDERHQ
ncbi:MAG: VOC family protein [Candidatus Sericytochromatia bacterium]|nr:VOC family protein [Candidatus Sericytochromatia bacterium]